MYKVKFSIKGLSPLRYNKDLGRDKEASNKKKMTHEQQIEDALSRSYKDEKGQFYIPTMALRRCFINGGKKVKIGRTSASRQLEAIMVFDNNEHFLGTDKYKIQDAIVRIPPKTGARVSQYWVVIEEWELQGIIVAILDDVFPSEALKEAIMFAGMYEGLLDGRPQLGRFELTNFQKIKG